MYVTESLSLKVLMMIQQVKPTPRKQGNQEKELWVIRALKYVCHVLKTVEEKIMKIHIKLCPVIIMLTNTLKVQMKCEKQYTV